MLPPDGRNWQLISPHLKDITSLTLAIAFNFFSKACTIKLFTAVIYEFS
jgi:hypothetical protein